MHDDDTGESEEEWEDENEVGEEQSFMFDTKRSDNETDADGQWPVIQRKRFSRA
jgi:hypothetical protein